MCSWEEIRGENRFLDLGDPFATEGEWKDRADENEFLDVELLDAAFHLRHEASHGPASHHTQRQEAYDLYRCGQYAEAEAVLTHLLEEGLEPPDTHCHLARLCLITDQIVMAREYVAQAWAARGNAEAYVVARTIWLQLALEFLDPDDTPAPDPGFTTPASLLLGR